jgi:hypothetical protein
MWPFTKRDNRPPSEAAKAIAYSLENEPERWLISARFCDVLEHDSDVWVNTQSGTVTQPRCLGSSPADVALILAAVNKWVGKIVLLPEDDDDDEDEPEPEPVPTVPRHQLN